MISARWLRVFILMFFCLLLFVTACASNPPSRYSQIQKETTRRGAPPAVIKTAEQGSTFNKFFPGSTGAYNVIPAQEKKGFAEYKVNKDGKTVAMLSISDTLSVPAAAAKYKNSTEVLANYPIIDQGNTATGLLVSDRYQVKVLSRDPSFTRDDRVAWLQKFDLRGLAKLESTTASSSVPQSSKIPANSNSAPKLPRVLSPQPAT
ncbi:hypothetical protein [Chlorogloeopsis sp. ULAP02]|uniref:hypothetical protein n=1 Tax=Chlorogloeopsis sp. ULAP02 TaxID=3107926 RepID=UPI003134CEE5